MKNKGKCKKTRKKRKKTNLIGTRKMEAENMETITETKQNQPNAQTRTRCEVYSRVVGYLRPVDQWNEGKQAEFAEREEYVIKPVPAQVNATNEIAEEIKAVN